LTEECQATLEEEPEDEPIVPSGATPEQAKDIEAKIQTIRNNNEDLMRKQKRIRKPFVRPDLRLHNSADSLI
jgi:hypothetical protein